MCLMMGGPTVVKNSLILTHLVTSLPLITTVDAYKWGKLFERPRLYYVGDPNLTAYSVSIDVCTYSREDGYGRRTTERRAAHARSQPTSGGGFLLRSFSLRFCTGLRLRAPRCLRTGRLSTYSPSNEPSKSQCCELFFEVLRCRRGHQEKKRTQHDLFTALVSICISV